MFWEDVLRFRPHFWSIRYPFWYDGSALEDTDAHAFIDLSRILEIYLYTTIDDWAPVPAFFPGHHLLLLVYLPLFIAIGYLACYA